MPSIQYIFILFIFGITHRVGLYFWSLTGNVPCTQSMECENRRNKDLGGSASANHMYSVRVLFPSIFKLAAFNFDVNGFTKLLRAPYPVPLLREALLFYPADCVFYADVASNSDPSKNSGKIYVMRANPSDKAPKAIPKYAH